MKKLIYIGIDVSSATLDLCVRREHNQESFIINNQVKAIRKFIGSFKQDQLIIGMENTGRHNWFLYEVLAESKHLVFVLPPLHLKKSMGIIRGKSDSVDAIRIACFIEKHYQELKPWKQASESIQKLKILLTERNFRTKVKGQLLKQKLDYVKMKKLGIGSDLLALNQEFIAQISQQIKHIEADIQSIIDKDLLLKEQSDLMQTIPGVGKVLSWVMLAKTDGFTTITDPRKMACFSGVVPFDFQSGTSIRGKKRVSIYADKYAKTTLHLAAMSAIRLENDLRTYYQRKVGEGKNKMLVLNAVRNKIIHRIFAVVKNQKPYSLLELS